MRVILPPPTIALLSAAALLASACGAPAPSADRLPREIRLVGPRPVERQVVSPVERGGGEAVRALRPAARHGAAVVRPTAARSPSPAKTPRPARFVSIVPSPDAAPPAPPVVATAAPAATPTAHAATTPTTVAAPDAGQDGIARDGSAEDGAALGGRPVPARATLPGVPGSGDTCLVAPKGRIADALGGSDAGRAAGPTDGTPTAAPPSVPPPGGRVGDQRERRGGLLGRGGWGGGRRGPF